MNNSSSQFQRAWGSQRIAPSVFRSEKERCNFRVTGQPLPRSELPRQPAEHTHNSRDAQCGAHHEDTEVPVVRGRGDHPRRRHEGSESPSDDAG